MTVKQKKAAVTEAINEAFNKGNYEVLKLHFNSNFIEHQFGLHPTIEGMTGDIQFLSKAFPDLTLLSKNWLQTITKSG